jgi:uncharacterized membrane protein
MWNDRAMFDSILKYAIRLLLALWLGGVFIIAFVEAPAKFRATELDRNQIVAVGRQVFAAVNRFELIVGPLLLLAALAAVYRGEPATTMARVATVCIAAMVLIALVQALAITPRIAELSRALDLVNRAAGDPRYATLRRLHIGYSALEGVKIICGMIALAWRG